MENDLATAETQEAAQPEPTGRPAWRLPLTLTLVALLVWFGFHTVALVLERNNLIAVKGNFDVGMKEAEKMQAQLQTLVTQTSELAGKGNASARAVIEELGKKGIPLQSAAPQGK